MKREQTGAMRAVMSSNTKCELCGSKRDLQAHHIIPIACGGVDTEENILCVCKKCHALLTPHSLLTKIGISRVRNWEYMFYKHFNDLCEAGERVTVIDVFDYLEENVFPIFRVATINSNARLYNIEHYDSHDSSIDWSVFDLTKNGGEENHGDNELVDGFGAERGDYSL